MYLLFRLFNSVVFVTVNLTLVLYTFKRFFCVLKTHYKLMKKAKEFNSIVNQSRESLEYISKKVTETMDEIKEDIAKELSVTDQLTKLSSKVAVLLQRFASIEEAVIELVRMDHNMESVRIETPANINEEVTRILAAAKRKEQETQLQSERPKTPIKLKTSTTTFIGTKESLAHEPNVKSSRMDSSNSRIAAKEKPERPRTPVLPEVRLLNESKHSGEAKPIGFRQSRKCEV